MAELIRFFGVLGAVILIAVWIYTVFIPLSKKFIVNNILPQYKIQRIDGCYYPLYRYNGTWLNFLKDGVAVKYGDLMTATYHIETQKKVKKLKPKTYYIW